MKKIYNNYVFISYNHEDIKIAESFVKKLDEYKLPVSICKKHPDKPRQIRRIFRDVDSMGAGGILSDKLKQELDDTNFLVVLCSPNSAKSKWVNDEITYFRSLGRSSEQIIPIIIDGVPHSEDEDKECFPPALPNQDPSCANLTKDGFDKTFVRLLSGLYSIQFDELWNRYEIARKRKQRIIIFTALAVCLISSCIAIWLWHLNTELAHQNRKLSIENIRYGCRKVLNYLDDGEFVKARHMMTELVSLWQSDYQTEAPEFEQAVRAVYRYEHTDGVVRLYNIPISLSREYLSSDSTSFYLLDYNDKKRYKILQYDSNSGDFMREIFPPKDMKDTVLSVLAMRDSHVLYSKEQDEFGKLRSSLHVYDLANNKDYDISHTFFKGKFISENQVVVYGVDTIKIRHHAIIYTFRKQKIAKTDTLLLPFYPRCEAIIGDSLVFMNNKRIAIYNQKTSSWSKEIQYNIFDSSTPEWMQAITSINPQTGQFASLNAKNGLRLYSVEEKDSIILGSQIKDGIIALNDNGSMMAIWGQAQNSLEIFATFPNMAPLYKTEIHRSDSSTGINHIYFITPDKILFEGSSGISVYQVFGDFRWTDLYSPDGTVRVQHDMGSNHLQMIKDSTDQILLTIDSFSANRPLGFSPRGRYLLLGSSYDDSAQPTQISLLDYRQNKKHTLPTVEALPLSFPSTHWSGLSFSKNEKQVIFIKNSRDFSGGECFILNYDIATKKETIIPTHSNPIMQIELSPDNKLVAVISGALSGHSFGKSLELYKTPDLSGWTPLITFNIDEDIYVQQCCFSPDGKSLLAGYSNGTVRCWDVATGKQATPVMSLPNIKDAYLSHIDISDDGIYAMLTIHIKNNPEYYIWHIPSGTLVDHLTNEWCSFLTDHVFDEHYQADFCRGDNRKIIVNDIRMNGYSRIFYFPTLDELIGMYKH